MFTACSLFGWASPKAFASSWLVFKTTSSPLAFYPNVNWSSGAYNQTNGGYAMESCSSGTWSKYLFLEIAGHILHSYSGTMCPTTYFGHNDANSREGCRADTSGTWYANCYRWA